MNPCIKWYYNNLQNTLPLLDVVQATVNIGENRMDLFFPYPFQLMGLADIETWSGEPPYTEILMNLDFALKSAGVQDTNATMIQKMFAVMMYANRDYNKYETSPFLGGIKYTPLGIGNYPNYFDHYLNADQKTIYYNQFLFPSYLINNFWANEVTFATPQETQGRLLDLAQKIFNISDRRLWGAPGLYTVYFGDTDALTLDLPVEWCQPIT